MVLTASGLTHYYTGKDKPAIGADFLIGSVARGYVTELRAATGAAGFVLAEAGRTLGGLTFIARRKAIAIRQLEVCRKLKSPCRVYQAHYALDNTAEVAGHNLLVAIAEDIADDGFFGDIAEEFCGFGCIVVKVR